MIISIAGFGNLLSIEAEQDEARTSTENFQYRNTFENRVLEGHDDVELLLAGRYHTISWKTGVDAVRFDNRFMGLPDSTTGITSPIAFKEPVRHTSSQPTSHRISMENGCLIMRWGTR